MKTDASSIIDSAQPAITTCPEGFLAGGACCGIKPSGNDDLALVICPSGANAAAMFTRNRVCGAPVTISRSHLQQSHGRARALIINSGCANAATGEEGLARASRVMNALSLELDCPLNEVLMNSTGVIGMHLPDERIIGSLRELISSCSAGGLHAAARAIMTTDTRVKLSEQSIRCKGRTCRVVGIAKGAGMIHPNMATMIAVLMTDADIESSALDQLLHDSVEQSFHRITVDGDTSTNDAVFALASGSAGSFPTDLVGQALDLVTRDLAIQILRDAEGATKLIHVRVSGAGSEADAFAVAQTVASSLLVRTSVTGGDPNWGRVLAAAGRSGVPIDPTKASLHANGVPMLLNGSPVQDQLEPARIEYQRSSVVFDLELSMGTASDEFFSCDLTEQYVQINAEYTT